MIFTIAAKELKGLFASPLAWMVLTAVQVISGYAFLKRLDDFLQIQPQLVQLASPPGVTELVVTPLYATTAIVLLFAVPLLGMRSIAEERRNQTMVFLTSAPVSISQIVLGKFLGLTLFVLLIVLLVTAMPLTLATSTHLDYGLIASLCAGLILIAAAFSAVSLYISCLTTYPMAAAFGAFAALLLMILMGEAAADGLRARGWQLPAAFVQVFSPMKNFEPLGKGLVDTYAIACSIMLVVVFIVLAVRRLDGRRLRG
ncbi:MAG: transporter permease [Betaproteobacteria bacterium]|jgi:ABC-2 type transport system permease protein|nr:transporter permease [Betaproteobacteria bacterium]MEA3158200.1 gliding motility-associated transport system permease protein [Betaproteobacteria bacterium]